MKIMNVTSSTPVVSKVRDGLRRLVASNPHASSFLLLLATQKRSPRTTTADHLRVQFRTECGVELSKEDARNLLKAIAATGAADYIRGTRFGHSRVQWRFRTTSLGRAAHGDDVALGSWVPRRSAAAAKAKPVRSPKTGRTHPAAATPTRRDIGPERPAYVPAEGVISVKCGTGDRWIEIKAPITGAAEPTVGAAIASAMQALDAASRGGHDPKPPFSLLKEPA